MKIKLTFFLLIIFIKINAQSYSTKEAITLADTLQKIEMLSEKGKTVLLAFIQDKPKETNSSFDILKQQAILTGSFQSSQFLEFLAIAFNAELVFRTYIPNPEIIQAEFKKLGLNELSTAEEFQAALVKLEPKFKELKGMMIEQAIEGKTPILPRGVTMPFRPGSQQEQELIHPKRSVIGKHCYQILADLKKVGLVNNLVYKDVLAAITKGNLFIESLVLNYAAERSHYYETYADRKTRELVYLDTLEKYNVLTSDNKTALIDSYQPFELKNQYGILPYCNQTKIIKAPSKEQSPADVYESYYQVIQTLVPAFDYRNFQFTIDSTAAGDNVMRLDATISFMVENETYQHCFFYDYYKIVLDEWDTIDSLMPIANDFYKPVNKWLANQNLTKRLHFANKATAGSVDGKTEFGLILLTQEKLTAWGESTTYFLSRESYNNQFNTKNTQKIIEFYDSLGLFSHLSLEEISEGKAKAKKEEITSYSSILYCFPKLIFNFDWETGNLKNPYEELVNDFAKISKGNFQPMDVFDTFDESWELETTNLSFVVNGKQYQQVLEMKGDWLDPTILTVIDSALINNAINGKFQYIEEENGYGGYIFLEPAQYELLKKRQSELFYYRRYFESK